MKITLHLGAHKTASTYIQTRLDAGRDGLAVQGTALALVPEMRAAIKAKLDKPRLLRLTSSRPSSMLAAEIGTRIKEANESGVQRLIISEENLLGPMSRLLTDVPFYDHAERRLKAVMPHLDGHDLTLALSVRNYATFYRSVWGFELRDAYRPFDQALRDLICQRSGEWPALVQRIKALFGPGVPLVLWQHEDFPVIEPRVYAALAGQDHCLEPSNQRPLQGPSAAAIRRLEKLSEEGPVTPDIIRRVLRVKSQDKGFAAYSPWSDAERAKLNDRYARDIATLQGMPITKLTR